MLVSEGKTALKRYGFDDSDPLLTWMNAGLNEFQLSHDWEFLESLATMGVAAGGSPINLASGIPDLFKIQSIRSTTHKVKLKYMTLSEFEREIEDPSQAGAPYLYTIMNVDQLSLYPVPDESTSFRIIYQKKLAAMTTDGAQMPGPDTIHYPIILASAYIALQAENEEDRASTAQGQFEVSVNRLWSRFNKQELDEPQQVVDAAGYGEHYYGC